MYFIITKSFLNSHSKEFLITAFNLTKNSIHKTKKELVDKIYSESTQNSPKRGNTISALSLCEYCRNIKVLKHPARNGKNRFNYCTQCGRMSPNKVFLKNIERTTSLIRLASKMINKNEKSDKAILLEQSIVSLATSVEILLRETYSLIYDLKHVIIGESIYSNIYAETKNDFTNLGFAVNRFKKLCNVNLKNELQDRHYKLLTGLFAKRHCIVHNNGVKDSEYVSQMAEDKVEIGKELKLTVVQNRKFFTALNQLKYVLEKKLSEYILNHNYSIVEIIWSLIK
jgi:hypothetical protein